MGVALYGVGQTWGLQSEGSTKVKRKEHKDEEHGAGHRKDDGSRGEKAGRAEG